MSWGAFEAMHNLLFVDDDEEIIELFEPSFSKCSFNFYSASDSAKAIAIATDNPIDVIVCDVVIPHKPGQHVINQTHRFKKKPIILAITGYDDVEIGELFDQNIHMFFRKPVKSTDLIAAINRYLRLFDKNEELRKMLTPREFEILQLVSEGFTSKEIAKKCFISFRTVETHKQNLLKKFDAKNTVELLAKLPRNATP